MTLYYNDPAELEALQFQHENAIETAYNEMVLLLEQRAEFSSLRKEWKAMSAKFAPADATNTRFNELCKMRIACEAWTLTPENWVRAAQQVVAVARLRGGVL